MDWAEQDEEYKCLDETDWKCAFDFSLAKERLSWDVDADQKKSLRIYSKLRLKDLHGESSGFFTTQIFYWLCQSRSDGGGFVWFEFLEITFTEDKDKPGYSFFLSSDVENDLHHLQK